MSGLIQVIEVAMGAGLLAQAIATQVYKTKLRNIINQHQEEFQLMKQLNTIINQLLGQQSLSSQLQTIQLFSSKNWNFINQNMQKKRQIAHIIMESFKDVSAVNYQFTVRNGIDLGMKSVMAVYLLVNFFTGKQNGWKDLKVNIKQVSEYAKSKFRTQSSQKINSQKNQIQIQNLNSSSQSTQFVKEASKPKLIQSFKTFMKQQFFEYLRSGLRAVFVALMIWGFIQGVKSLIELSQTLEKNKKYFQSQGQFQKMEQGLIILMITLSSDIFNLLNASKALVNEVRSVFVLNSYLMPQFREKYLLEAEKFTQSQIEISDELINETEQLYNSIKDINEKAGNKQGYVKAFRQILDAYQPYMKKSNPRPILNKMTQNLTREIGLISLASDKIIQNQKYINDFIEQLTSTMIQRKKDIQKLQDKDWKKLQEIDKNYYKDIFNNYKYRLFSLNNFNKSLPKKDDQLSDVDKTIIVIFLANFTDKFYYDSENGQSVYGKKIGDFKSNDSNLENLVRVFSSSNIIPLEDNHGKEQQLRKPFIEKAHQFKPEYFDLEKYDIKQLYRFMRLQLKKDAIVIKNRKFDKIISYEGLLFQAKKKMSDENSQKFAIQRNYQDKSISLLELKQA